AYAIERKTRKGNFFIVTTMLDGPLDERRKISMEASSALGSMGEIVDTVTITGDPDTPDRTHFLYHTLIGEKALRETLSSLATEVDISKVDHAQLAKAAADLPPEPAPRPERRAATAPRNPDRPVAVGTESTTTEQQPDTAGTSPWDDCSDFVTFFIEQELYAVPIFLVHDIKETMPFSRLPNQPPHLLGVINLRGNVLPLFDLRRLLGMPPRPFDRKTVIIILDIAGKKTGCVVDAISDVVTLEPGDKQAKPLLGRRTTAEYVRFIGKDQRTGAFLIVLDIERMLSR
ncbi:MAG TPA: chemotaxis protein CheW, partial [bacterium]|nr:chemotaxis protein CheW [bacterium]